MKSLRTQSVSIILSSSLMLGLIALTGIAASCNGGGGGSNPSNLASLVRQIARAEASNSDDIMRALNAASRQSGRSVDDLAVRWSDNVATSQPTITTVETRLNTLSSRVAANTDVVTESRANQIIWGTACEVIAEALASESLPSSDEIQTALFSKLLAAEVPIFEALFIAGDIGQMTSDIESGRPSFVTLYLAQWKYC